ncbi:MAG: hypothetical protein ACU826_06560 [Gammaproteobacteria bacterium]
MKGFLTVIVFFAALGASGQTPAKALLPEQVPDPLKPWIDWVLQDERDAFCPFVSHGGRQQKRCGWPSRLTLDLDGRHGRFAIRWKIFAESWVALPGDAKHWPQNVAGNRKNLLVSERNGRPAVRLQAGTYGIEGEFFWDFLPENLAVPEDTGLVDLTLNGKRVDFPEIRQGQLWLKESDAGGRKKPASLQNRLDLQVFRKIIDDVPLEIVTLMELDVSGDPREVYLPSPLLSGFIPLRLDSPLPARLEPDGRLLIQVRPGRWRVELTARHAARLTEIELPEMEPTWPEAEVWLFDARPYQRLVEIKNLATVDPQQTNAPGEWSHLPAYRVSQGDKMVIQVIRRGDPEPDPDKLNLERTLWLDFDGRGYTVNDKISGTMTRGWRLNALEEIQPGKATLDGRDQLITRLPGTDLQGVEVRKGAVDLNVDSRFEGPVESISAVGWQQSFNSVKAVMHLPPGWRMLAASGVDNVPDTWVYRWTLLDLFLVLIASLAIGRLWSLRWGLLALVTLAVIWHEPGAPHFIWLNILAVTALLRVLPKGRFFSFVAFCRNLFWIGLIVIAVPFMVDQVRIGIYPQLERPWQRMGGEIRRPQAPEAQSAGDAMMMEESVMRKSISRAQSLADSAPAGIREALKSDLSVNFDRIDPDARVQTGPGLPQWKWRQIQLSWNGPVDADQRLRFWFMTPAMTSALNFIRVVLLGVLALLLFGVFKDGFRFRSNAAVGSALPLWLVAVFLAAAPAQDAYADFPDKALLEDLKKRLLEPPECLPACAQIPVMQLRATADALKIDLEIHALEAVAVPLPAQDGQWFPNRVLVDGAPSDALYRGGDGQLWIQLPEGRHAVALDGKTPLLERFSLGLPLMPRRVEWSSEGWTLKGVHEHGVADSQLQFERTGDRPAKDRPAALEPGALPPFFRVERTLQLGLDWRVLTRVVRVSPRGAAALAEVPLLAGESVVTPGVKIENGKVLVNFSARQSVMRWDSMLEKTERIDFKAAETDQWTEVWRADVSPIWHMETDGIAVVHHQDGQGRRLPEWRPWPGEEISLTITRPEGVKGRTLTIDGSSLQVTPGKRAQDATLKISYRSSEGSKHSLILPKQAELQSVAIDGITQPIRQKGRQVILPIRPGKQEAELKWRESLEIGTVLKTPQVNLGMPSVNNSIRAVLGQDRWILFTFGPPFGPAVLFWGVLVVLALLAAGLGRLPLTPIRHWQWFLLLVGLTQIPLAAGLTVVGWLIATGARGRYDRVRPKYFNAAQVGLGLLTLVSLVFLFVAIKQGLLGSPEMQISGNQSSAYNLNWYQDRSPETLPAATVVSVPLSVYRLLMLSWSLWLALSLLDWLKWGWKCFSAGGLWNKDENKEKKLEIEEKTSK